VGLVAVFRAFAMVISVMVANSGSGFGYSAPMAVMTRVGFSPFRRDSLVCCTPQRVSSVSGLTL